MTKTYPLIMWGIEIGIFEEISTEYHFVEYQNVTLNPIGMEIFLESPKEINQLSMNMVAGTYTALFNCYAEEMELTLDKHGLLRAIRHEVAKDTEIMEPGDTSGGPAVFR